MIKIIHENYLNEARDYETTILDVISDLNNNVINPKGLRHQYQDRIKLFLQERFKDYPEYQDINNWEVHHINGIHRSEKKI